jgi:hypothetical protein
MNRKHVSVFMTHRRLISIFLLGLTTLLQACATPLPQSAYPIESKIAAVLGTSEFVLDSKIRYTSGCKSFQLFSPGCYTDFWNVCIRFNNVASFKKATRNDYAGPDADLEYARNSGASITFRDGEWSRYIHDDVNCPSIR